MDRESNGHHTRQPNGFPVEDRRVAIDAMQSQSSEYVLPFAACTSLEKSEMAKTAMDSFIWNGCMMSTGISPSRVSLRIFRSQFVTATGTCLPDFTSIPYPMSSTSPVFPMFSDPDNGILVPPSLDATLRSRAFQLEEWRLVMG